jgi:hypothetical protein
LDEQEFASREGQSIFLFKNVQNDSGAKATGSDVKNWWNYNSVASVFPYDLHRKSYALIILRKGTRIRVTDGEPHTNPA